MVHNHDHAGVKLGGERGVKFAEEVGGKNRFAPLGGPPTY